MHKLSPIQARVLACLMEKQETTPDQYPLTLNALRMACNQKSSRDPVTDYGEGEVGHTIRELETLGLVREEWGSRVPRYRHLAAKALEIHSKGIALLCVLMLRGPQTQGELKTRTQRLYAFDDLDDVHYALETLKKHQPPLVTDWPRQAGQKEHRYAHLLCGQPEMPAPANPARPTPAVSPTGVESRLAELEAEVQALRERLDALEGMNA